MNKFFIICFLTCNGQCAWSQTAVQNMLKSIEKFSPEASLSVCVRNLETQELLLNHLAEKNLTPASSLKLLTTATALQILGASHTFSTQLWYRGQIKEGVLHGDLILVCGGDPTFYSEYFQNHTLDPIKTWIKENGIKEVKGSLILDYSKFNSARLPTKWIWEDMGNYYGSGPAPINLFDNSVVLTFSSPTMAGQKAQLIDSYPVLDGIAWESEVLSSDINADRAYVFGAPGQQRRVIRGTIPKGKSSFAIKASMPEPEKYAHAFIINLLAAQGINVNDKKYEFTYQSLPNATCTLLGTIASPTLAKIVTATNIHSVNLFAEALLLQLSLTKNGKASIEESLEIVYNYWKEKGLELNANLYDGSGLARYNAISTDAFTKIICLMKQDQNWWVLLNSLPESGKEGSLSGMFDAALHGRIMAKSGYLDKARSYTGIIKNDRGKWLAFSVIINNYTQSASSIRTQLANLIASFSELN